ncbi:hypothetical protein CRENBAI_012594 [Crenichthys baileyi]|uniref:Uncharacterized protein n=1 Tax=Crenichthys baileyi TaxID=28760 RepID=A0AAV9RU77_9TELE
MNIKAPPHDTVSAAAERTERQRDAGGETERNPAEKSRTAEKDVKLPSTGGGGPSITLLIKTVEDSEKISSTELIRLIQKKKVPDVKQQIRSQQEKLKVASVPGSQKHRSSVLYSVSPETMHSFLHRVQTTFHSAAHMLDFGFGGSAELV